MCHAVGLSVRSIKRNRVGPIPMSKLPPGQWRYLSNSDRF
jgi:23S rRNA pseudouridine2604 synthase